MSSWWWLGYPGSWVESQIQNDDSKTTGLFFWGGGWWVVEMFSTRCNPLKIRGGGGGENTLYVDEYVSHWVETTTYRYYIRSYTWRLKSYQHGSVMLKKEHWYDPIPDWRTGLLDSRDFEVYRFWKYVWLAGTWEGAIISWGVSKIPSS